jgi:hypothetical protein
MSVRIWPSAKPSTPLFVDFYAVVNPREMVHFVTSIVCGAEVKLLSPSTGQAAFIPWPVPPFVVELRPYLAPGTINEVASELSRLATRGVFLELPAVIQGNGPTDADLCRAFFQRLRPEHSVSYSKDGQELRCVFFRLGP